VTAERASKHIIVKNMNSIPHRGRFIVSSKASMYLKKVREAQVPQIIRIIT
jgi:hypothetical protein